MGYATVAALLVGLGLQPLVVRVMTSAAVLDMPSERSSHSVPTPRGGGVAVVAAVLIALLFLPPARPIAVAVLLCAVIGLVEDVRGVPVLPRFAAQLVVGVGAALLLAPTGMSIVVRVGAVAVVAAWFVAFVNAFNFMDGVNGISALSATLAGAVYAVLGLRYDLPVLLGAGVVIGVAALTFLPWNLGRARIFLGDVGSYGLGAGLAALAAYAVLHGIAPEAALAPLAVYLADTGSTLLRRILRGEDWWNPHRTHGYQRLTDAGWTHQRVAVSVCLVAATISLCVLVGTSGHRHLAVRWSLDAVALAVLAAYLAAPARLAARQARRDRATCPTGAEAGGRV